jgi:N-acetylmuramoyl-L-alanine amidase
MKEMAGNGAIKYLTIHCAATPEGRDVKATDIEKWDIAKFGQKSYHLIVLLDGTYHRSLPDDVRGAHVGKHNTGNIGICYVGGVAKDGKAIKDTRTEAQKKTLRTLVATYRARYPGIKVMGHRDWSPDRDGDGVIEPNEWLKGCPSFDVATEL